MTVVLRSHIHAFMPAYAPPRALLTGGFEHLVSLRMLWYLDVDGFWEAFEDLPASFASRPLRYKLDYLRRRLEEAADPLL